MVNIFDIKEVKNNSSYCDINGELYRFGRASHVMRTDGRNVANCGEWNDLDCWVVYGMKAGLDPRNNEYELYAIENDKLKKIKLIIKYK